MHVADGRCLVTFVAPAAISCLDCVPLSLLSVGPFAVRLRNFGHILVTPEWTIPGLGTRGLEGGIEWVCGPAEGWC